MLFADSVATSISIHSLRVEGDGEHRTAPRAAAEISIHSLRVEGDAISVGRFSGCGRDFNPLPPCGGRRSILSTSPSWITISIHSLRVEGDRSLTKWRWYKNGFQSTPSVWRETRNDYRSSTGAANFNPLPPCGGRPLTRSSAEGVGNFNPLPPCGGRRGRAILSAAPAGISIHSLRVEGDCASYIKSVCFEISIHSLRVEGDSRRP